MTSADVSVTGAIGRARPLHGLSDLPDDGVMRRVGRALLWAFVTPAVCASIGWAITAAVTSIVHAHHASDIQDGVIGMAFLLGAPLGFALALLMPRAQPSNWVAKPFRRYAAWDRRSPRRARQREWIIRQPVEASIVLGGSWGLWMFAVSPLMAALMTSRPYCLRFSWA
jgi:hypothetical protein